MSALSGTVLTAYGRHFRNRLSPLVPGVCPSRWAPSLRCSWGPRKLLPAVLLEIKRLRAEGLTQAVTRQRLGMSTRTVIHAL
jgi:hypothetical protein